MSAKEEAMTVRIPKSRRAQGACSREDPQPKLPPETTRIFDSLYPGWLRMNSGFSEPSALYRRAAKREIPRPVRLMVLTNAKKECETLNSPSDLLERGGTYLRKRAGMMRSVSMLARSRGAAIPLTISNLGIPAEAELTGADFSGAAAD